MREDQKNRRLGVLWGFICLINLLAILFLTGTTTLTAVRICRAGEARAFLDTLSALPAAPWVMPVCAVTGYAALLTASFYRRLLRRHELGCCVIEVALCIFITLAMHMSYKGVILLVLADLLDYLDSWSKRSALIALMAGLYVAADADLVQLVWPMVTFEHFARYYPARQAVMLLGVRNLIASAAVISFVLFSMLLVRIQSAETRRIQRLNTELAQANDQLHQMAMERERMAETRERNRLAREIHDTLGHSLTGISVGLDACMALLSVSVDAARQQLELVSQVARHGLEDVRASVGALRADDAPRHVSITEAIQRLAADSAAASGAQIPMELALDGVTLTNDEENAVIRLVQEGITNALRHGRASRIEVRIAPDPAGRELALRVQDNGVGCAAITPNFGLRHMQERFGLLGGWVRFDGSNGFLIEAALPLRREGEA